MKILWSFMVLLIGIALLAGCSGSKKAEIGDRVRVSYVGKLQDGSVFDSTTTGDAIEFVVGEHQVIPGFENSVVGMEVGETKTFTLPPEEAYGPHRPELTHTYPADSFPPEVDPQIGGQLDMQTPDGRTVRLTITDIDADSNVTVDANHHLAGKTLVFDLTLVEVIEATGAEEDQ